MFSWFLTLKLYIIVIIKNIVFIIKKMKVEIYEKIKSCSKGHSINKQKTIKKEATEASEAERAAR